METQPNDPRTHSDELNATDSTDPSAKSDPTQSSPPAVTPEQEQAIREVLEELSSRPRLRKPPKGALTWALIFVTALPPLAYTIGVATIALFLMGSAAVGLFHLEASSWGPGLLIAGIQMLTGWGALFVLAKPWLKPRYQVVSLYPVDRQRHKAFFLFSERIARAVGAPAPAEVRLSLEADAVTRYERVQLRGKRSLVLTVGLALLRSVSTPVWAAILAHEYGRYGTRRGRVGARLLQYYREEFAASLNERDAWDDALVRLSKSHSSRAIRITSWGLFGFVFLGRLLQGVAVALTAPFARWLARRLELEADTYQVRVCGPNSIGRSAEEIKKTAQAQRDVITDLDHLWLTGRLCDDVSTLVAARASGLRTDDGWTEDGPAELHSEERLDQPSLSQRLRHAQRVRFDVSPPAWDELESLPACSLLRDPRQVGRALSAKYYQHSMASQIDPRYRMNSDQLAIELSGERVRRTTLEQTLGDLPLETWELFLDPSAASSKERLDVAACEEEWSVEYERALPLLARREAADAQYLQAGWGLALLRSGIPLKPRSLGLMTADPERLEEIRQGAEIECEATGLSLVPLSAAFNRYWNALLQERGSTLTSPGSSSKASGSNPSGSKNSSSMTDGSTSEDSTSEGNGSRLNAIVTASRALEAIWPRVQRLRQEYRLASAQRELSPHLTSEAAVEHRLQQEERVRREIEVVLSSLERVDFPFPHAKTQLTVAEYLDYHPWEESTSSSTLDRADRIGPRLFALQERLLAHLWYPAVEETQEDQTVPAPVAAIEAALG